jgi:hypothetical protein
LTLGVTTLCCHATKLECQREVSGHTLFAKGVQTGMNKSLRQSVPLLLGSRQLRSKLLAGRHTSTADGGGERPKRSRCFTSTAGVVSPRRANRLAVFLVVEERKGSAVPSWKRRKPKQQSKRAGNPHCSARSLVVQRDPGDILSHRAPVPNDQRQSGGVTHLILACARRAKGRIGRGRDSFDGFPWM